MGRVRQSGGVRRRAGSGSRAICKDGSGWGSRLICTVRRGGAVGRYAPTRWGGAVGRYAPSAGGGSRAMCTDGPECGIRRYAPTAQVRAAERYNDVPARPPTATSLHCRDVALPGCGSWRVCADGRRGQSGIMHRLDVLGEVER